MPFTWNTLDLDVIFESDTEQTPLQLLTSGLLGVSSESLYKEGNVGKKFLARINL